MNRTLPAKSVIGSAVRFETLEKICEFLDCQPGDMLEYKPSADESARQGDHGDDDGP